MVVASRHKVLPPKPGKDSQLIPMGKKPESVNQAVAGMKGGEVREGFLHGENLLRKPDYVVEEKLSAEEQAQKKLLQSILGKVIEPNALSSKSTPAMDRRSLVTKLGRTTLDVLLRLVPERLQDMKADGLKELADNLELISEEEKAEIQNLYMDISP